MAVILPFFLTPNGSGEDDATIETTGNLPTSIYARFGAAQPANATITVKFVVLKQDQYPNQLSADVEMTVAVLTKTETDGTPEDVFGNIYASGFTAAGADADTKAPPIFSGRINLYYESGDEAADPAVPEVYGGIAVG